MPRYIKIINKTTGKEYTSKIDPNLTMKEKLTNIRVRLYEYSLEIWKLSKKAAEKSDDDEHDSIMIHVDDLILMRDKIKTEFIANIIAYLDVNEELKDNLTCHKCNRMQKLLEEWIV